MIVLVSIPNNNNNKFNNRNTNINNNISVEDKNKIDANNKKNNKPNKNKKKKIGHPKYHTDYKNATDIYNDNRINKKYFGQYKKNNKSISKCANICIDMWEHILTFLDMPDMLRLLSTCKTIKYNVRILHLYHISTNHKMNITNKILSQPMFRDVISLDISGNQNVTYLNHLQNIKYLNISNFLSQRCAIKDRGISNLNPTELCIDTRRCVNFEHMTNLKYLHCSNDIDNLTNVNPEYIRGYVKDFYKIKSATKHIDISLSPYLSRIDRRNFTSIDFDGIQIISADCEDLLGNSKLDFSEAENLESMIIRAGNYDFRKVNTNKIKRVSLCQYGAIKESDVVCDYVKNLDMGPKMNNSVEYLNISNSDNIFSVKNMVNLKYFIMRGRGKGSKFDIESLCGMNLEYIDLYGSQLEDGDIEKLYKKFGNKVHHDTCNDYIKKYYHTDNRQQHFSGSGCPKYFTEKYFYNTFIGQSFSELDR